MPKAPKKPKRPKARQLSSTQRGYGVEHRRFRADQLAWRVVCECCDRRPTNEIHHLVPLRGDRYHEDKLDPYSVLCTCKRCHVMITSVLEPGLPPPVVGRMVVFGRSGAGKSTWSIAQAIPDDIWDWDVKRKEFGLSDSAAGRYKRRSSSMSSDVSDAEFLVKQRQKWALESTRSKRPRIMIVNRCSDAYQMAEIMASRLVYIPCDEDTRQERLKEREKIAHQPD